MTQKVSDQATNCFEYTQARLGEVAMDNIRLRVQRNALLAALKAAVQLIKERNHYHTLDPDLERPEFRCISGCAGEALQSWEATIAAAERKD